MSLDWSLSLAGLVVGVTVGLTGMGGGALMTPILVLLFKVQPLAAVSSDLVAAFVMKPVGAGVHLRRGTVNTKLVGLLCIGSVPSAFAGVLLLRALGDGTPIDDTMKLLLGCALLVAATTILAKARVQKQRNPGGTDADVTDLVLRPGPTIAIGVAGGLIVGMTSVGSGSLMIVLLLLLYPTMTASRLVGSDLLQAIPLVGSAALGHILFGDFHLDVAASLLVGAVPGVYVGARWSASAPDKVIRPALVVVLAASGLKLVGVPTELVGAFLAAVAVGLLAHLGRGRLSARHVDHVGGGRGEVVEQPLLDVVDGT